MANRIAYSLTKPVPWHGAARIEKVFGGAVPLLATDLVAGNTVALFRVPKGTTVTALAVDFPTLDSNGSKTLTVSIGDAAVPARFISASNIGQAGGTGPITLLAGARGFTYQADTDIVLTIVASAATAVAGTPVVYLEGYIDA